MKRRITILAVALAVILSGCSKKAGNKSIAVFIPGIMADSAIYANLAKGVQTAVDAYNNGKSDTEKAELYIMEAGTNQAEWGPKITSLAATGKYDVIISSNPSLPDLVQPVVQQFPKQKFILLDAFLDGNENVLTVSYDQKDQGYLSGYIAALVSKTHKVALIAAQEYPIMNEVIYPNYEQGAKDAVSGTDVQIRIVGNWYDANKGLEIADSLIAAGVDVLLPICGGAAQGVIASAVNNNAKICWFDSNGFSKAENNVISSCMILQDKMAAQVTADYLDDKTEWGKAAVVGMKDGFIQFIEDDPIYQANVSSEIRAKMSEVIKSRM